jgi:hypothetical protein
MQKLLLLGDEAIAQAAIDAGMSGIYAYPGHPFNRDHRIRAGFARSCAKKASKLGGLPMKKRLEAALGHVVCRQTCHDLYEACGTERGRRCFCQFSHDRRQRRAGGSLPPTTLRCTRRKTSRIPAFTGNSP